MADILDRLDEMNESGAITYDVYSELHDLASQLEKRKVGKWKRKLIDSGYNSVWLCSECKEMIHLEFHNFKFCPYCGADMRGSENE